MSLTGLHDDAVFAALIGGSPIGSGVHREVFAAPDPAFVIKREKNFVYSNMCEWFIQGHVRDTDLEAIFGKIVAISKTGRYLMMEHLSDTAEGDGSIFPRIPDWLTDRKRSAFGRDAQGNVKVRDYGAVKLGDFLAQVPRVTLPYK